MSQAKVTTYYNTRKKRTGLKDVVEKTEIDRTRTFASFFEDLRSEQSKVVSEGTSAPVNKHTVKPSEKRKPVKVSKVTNVVKSKPEKKKVPIKNKIQNLSNQQLDIRLAFTTKGEATEADQAQEGHVLNETYDVDNPSASDISRTPKRHSPNSNAENSSTKKKKLQLSAESDDHSKVRRKLILSEESSSKEPEQKGELQPSMKGFSINKLDELKERLKKFDNNFTKLKDCHANKFKITTAISDCKGDSESRETETSVPEYVKYAGLASPDSTSLILPYTFKLLNEMFRCLDTVVSILYNRKEVCTFAKVKSGVQEMTKKAFLKSHLGQIQTVFPEAYSIKVEKNTQSFMNRNPGAPPNELVIYPNLKECPSSPKKLSSPSKVAASPNKNPTDSMSPSHLVERKKIFSELLLQVVLKHHQEFLLNLKPPIHISVDKLTKWHQKFPLDLVPEIKATPLPELPHIEKISSAQDVLNKVKGMQAMKTFHGQKVKKALQSLVDKNTKTPEKPSEDKGVVKTGLLKGIPKDLLDRIRARESANAIKDMTKTPEEKKRSEMLERIPEFVRILRTYFITERKAAVPLETVKKKLSDSYHTTMNEVDAQKHLELMTQIFPKWIFMVSIRKGVFVKIDKNMDINVLLQNMPKH